MQKIKTVNKENILESNYSSKISLAHRKKFAQFFTPYPIALLMSKWILGNENVKTVLEPAFGLGVFSRALLSQNENLDIKGFEIDDVIFGEAKQFFEENKNVEIQLQDYIFNDWENKYDGIICNPPYFKFHDYDNKVILKEIKEKLDYELNGFTNLYALFLLKSLSQLNQNGRAAYIIPSEFLNADYGKMVKSYLLKTGMLRHVIVIDFEENVFDDALTTACIILCANDKNEIEEENKKRKIQFSTITSIIDLEKIEDLIRKYPNYKKKEAHGLYDLEELNPNIKWRSYYQTQNSERFKNLVPFALFGKVVRGIATGSNEYFTFTKKRAEELNISEENLLPCICKSTDVKNSFFTETDFEILKSNNRPVFLFHAKGSLTENINEYIKQGEEKLIHKKYLTSSRNPWYSLEKRPPSPIWVSVFNRNGLRFIRNEAQISNLTTFHCIYPTKNNSILDISVDLLFAYLLTNTAREIFEDNRREYGNGLQKFEPNDINKSKILNLNLLSEDSKNTILTLYQEYRNSVLNGETDESKIKQIDEILLTEFRK